MALKFPGGDAFAYMDSNTRENPSGNLAWKLGYGWADIGGNPLASTLQQLYKPLVGSVYTCHHNTLNTLGQWCCDSTQVCCVSPARSW